MPMFLTACLALGVLLLADTPQEITFEWREADGKLLEERLEQGGFGTVSSVLILHDGETVFER